MVDAYKVGVTLALNGVVGAELKKIIAQLLEANKAAEALSATLKSMGVAGGGIAAATQGMATAAKNMQAASKNVSFLGPTGRKYGAMAAEFAGYEALKGGITMEDTIARAMIAAGIKVGPDYMSSSFAGGLRKSIFDTSTSYGVNLSDTQDAALQAMRALAPLSADQRAKLLPSLMNFAGAEVLGKHGTTMEEAIEAGIGLAHQLRAYSPEEIEPLLGAFAKLSMASPQSLSQMGRASSYYLPLLTAGLGMDPTELMAMGTVGSQMGLNTKAGTWLARMFQAPFVADLTSKRQSARRGALEDLGLVEDGKVVTKDPLEFIKILAAHASGMSAETRTKDFVAAFGQEGARAAAIFTDPAVMKNLLALTDGLRGAAGPEALRQQYANSPKVKFDQAYESMMKALTELGETVMPEVTSGIKTFTYVMKALSAVIEVPEWLGSKAAGAVKSLFSGSPVPSSQQQAVVINHSTNLDGRVLSQSVTQYQVDGMARAPASGSVLDTRMTPYYPGFGVQ